jgi:monoamine oxidase
LAAARVLAGAGRSIIILEARGRVGGRIDTRTGPDSPIPIELGAEFIHGRPEATWRHIREAGLVACDVEGEQWRKRGRRLECMDDFEDQLGRVMKRLKRLGRRDMSFSEFLSRYCSGFRLRDARALATSFVEGFDAADPERVSAKSIAQEQEGLGDISEEPQFRLLGGYAGLIAHLRRGLDPELVLVRLRHAVSEVRWGRGRVEVHVTDHRRRTVSVQARRAVITLPVGVLQVPSGQPGGVRFAPEVPSIRRAAAALGAGPVVKAVLRFREPFWEDDKVGRAATGPLSDGRSLAGAGFIFAPGASFPTWWTSLPLRTPVLTGWVGGPSAQRLSGLGEKAIAHEAIAMLASLLNQRPARLNSMLRAAHIGNWPADPWARGAYSYVTVGAQGARKTLATAVERTLYFAGEAADVGDQASTVAGAIASGERAAAQVLKTG